MAKNAATKQYSTLRAELDCFASLAMTKYSRGALAPEFCSTNDERTKSSGPDPVGWRRRWYRLHLDRARRTKNQEGETPTDA
jgi:hypothetical protein